MIPIVLASTSVTRAAILTGAGIPFQAASPGIDEGAVKREMVAGGASPGEVASALADTKAIAVSRNVAGLVIGADQTLDLDGALFDKADDLDEARDRLRLLRGRTHSLQTAVTVARDGESIWRRIEAPRLTMRSFSDDFLDSYLVRRGHSILSSVGCYQLEGEGAQLFAAVEGDYFAILGLPLWSLLETLRTHGALAR